MTQINLLPWREKARQTKKIYFGFIVFSCVLLALFFVALMHLYYHRLVNAQQARNDYLQAELDRGQAQLFSLGKQKKEQVIVESELNFIINLRKNNYKVIQLLSELTRIIPEGILLNKLVREENKLTLFGKAKSNLQITLFMENIAKSTIFKQPELTEITGKESSSGEERSFQLKVEQVG